MSDGAADVPYGELHDELVTAMQRVPDLAGRELVLSALSGGITNRNYRVDAAGLVDRFVERALQGVAGG